MDQQNKVCRNMSKTIGIANSGNIKSLFLLILVFQVNFINSYSNVRRSGSSPAIVHANLPAVKEGVNISPMLKPVNFKYEILNTTPSEIKPSANVNIPSKIIQSYQNEFQQNMGKQNVVNLPNKHTIGHNLINFTASDGVLFNKNGEKVQSYQEESFVDQMAEAFDIVDGDILPNAQRSEKVKELESEILKYVDNTFSKDSYDILEGVRIEPVSSLLGRNTSSMRGGSPRSFRSLKETPGNDLEEFDTQVMRKFDNYARDHVLSVNIPQAARFFGFKFTQGKSSFLTGFGLGFLAFGIKKLLLPLFIGAQIVKSVLIAMFLPSILGSLGKIVGKGLSQFSGSSANFGQQQVHDEELDYKQQDSTGYATDQGLSYTYPPGDGIGTYPADSLYGNQNDLANVAMSRYGPGGAKVTYLPNTSDNYYKHSNRKQEDYKIFHNIPASSLLLSNYDPFYSPLLSRLDSVFQRLGLGTPTAEGNGKNLAQERCRERLVCMMYASPAKYAPYSNLISAQLSRELNELRKPTSDNPEILRFFRYMKAAKDGQEGIDCARLHPSCPSLTAESGSVAMITTYNDINKLVSARKL